MSFQKTLKHGVLRLCGLVLAAAIVVLPYPLWADEYQWVGGTGWWDVDSNWDTAEQPLPDSTVWLSQTGANDIVVNYRNNRYPIMELHALGIWGTGAGIVEFRFEENLALNVWIESIGHIGTGKVTQTNGLHEIYHLFLGDQYEMGYGTYELSGVGNLHVTFEELIEKGRFIQNGGTHTIEYGYYLFNADYELHNGNLEVRTEGGTREYIGYGGTSTFTQTGGGHTVSGDLELGHLRPYDRGSPHPSGTYNLSGGDLLTERLFVGHSGKGVFIQTGGTNTVNQTLTLGENAGSEGEYELRDGILSAGSMHVGYHGSGSFLQTGGTIFCDYELYVGLGEGGGSYDLQGGNLWTQNTIVGDHGAGTFTQSGGRHSISGFLQVGTAAPGSYTLSGDGGLEADREDVGVSDTGVFTQTGGTHEIVNTLRLGIYPRGEGSYTLQSGSLSATEMSLGMAGRGAFSQEGGSVTLSGSLFLGSRLEAMEPFAPGTGSYSLSGGNLEAANEYVGYAGAGSFNHTRGRNTISDYLYVGYNEGSEGSYSLGGEGILAAQNEVIGRRGEGSFIQDGGSNRTDNLVVGSARGGRGSYLLSGTGSVRALEETIGLFGAGSFTQTGGENRVTNALRLAVNRTATGEYLLEGGTLRSGSLEVGRRGVFTQTGGTFQTGALSNVGEVNLEGGKTKVTGEVTNASTGTLNISHNMKFPGDVTNEGTIKTTGATVTWGGHFTNLGAYISDPSKQTFQDLVVGETGYLVGFSQDTFVVRGDFENRSTQNQLWQTDQAVLRFRTVLGQSDTEQISIHNFWLAGADLGPGGGAHNFRWGTLNVMGVTVNLLDGNPQNQGSALYVGKIRGLEIDEATGTILNIYALAGLNLYYNPSLNPELEGLTYSLYGINGQPGGLLVPTPVPASVLLLGSGLLGLGLLGWRPTRKA